jgi:hypothetical protein
MPSRIVDENRRALEAHRLIVHNRAGERGEVFDFEISRGVRNQSEAGGVRLRESIQGKGTDLLDDVLLRRGIDSVSRHAGTQLCFQVLHALPGTPHPHGTAQFFRLRAGEVRHDHRDAEQLELLGGQNAGPELTQKESGELKLLRSEPGLRWRYASAYSPIYAVVSELRVRQ